MSRVARTATYLLPPSRETVILCSPPHSHSTLTTARVPCSFRPLLTSTPRLIAPPPQGFEPETINRFGTLPDTKSSSTTHENPRKRHGSIKRKQGIPETIKNQTRNPN